MFPYKKENCLDSVNIKKEDNYLIKNLIPDKAHGKSIAFPLKLLFDSSLEKGIFPIDWKKINIVPVHKKENQ